MATSPALPTSLVRWRKHYSRWTSSFRRTETWKVRWAYSGFFTVSVQAINLLLQQIPRTEVSYWVWMDYLACAVCIYSNWLSPRGSPSDQPDNEGAFWGSVRVAGETAARAELLGKSTWGSSRPHGNTDTPEPRAQQEVGRRRKGKRSPHWRPGESTCLYEISASFKLCHN